MSNKDVLQGDWLPNISVDCVIFGFQENHLKVLLLKFRNNKIWSYQVDSLGEKKMRMMRRNVFCGKEQV